MGKYKDRLDKKDLVMLFVEISADADGRSEGGSGATGRLDSDHSRCGYKAIYTLLNDLTQGKTVSDPVTIGLDKVCTPETIDTCMKQ